MAVIEEVFFLPPMAVARLGGSDTPLASFTWVEDPSTHGAGYTVIQPATSLEVQPDGSVRPVLPTTIQFRDGALLRPVAPFFELWAKLQGDPDPKPLTKDLLETSGGSADGVSYTVSVANRKGARRVGDDSCAFGTQIQVVGNDHNKHPLLASGLGANPLVRPERPIPMGQFQVIRPTSGNPLGWISVNCGFDLHRPKERSMALRPRPARWTRKPTGSMRWFPLPIDSSTATRHGSAMTPMTLVSTTRSPPTPTTAPMKDNSVRLGLWTTRAME